MSDWKLLDVHAHMSHVSFSSDIDEVISECISKQVAVISNGTDKSSNQFSLKLATKYKGIVYPAMGIYPVEALYNMGYPIEDLSYSPEQFDLEDQIDFINQAAKDHKIIAIGEIGMDGHSLKEDTYDRQEEVFIRLARIGIDNDLPLIVHSRKMESRTLGALEKLHAPKVIMHCFCGNVSEACEYAKKYNWMFSLPVTTPNHSKLSVLSKRLGIENILLETDSPYLNIERGVRNTPVNIIKTLNYLSQVKGISQAQVQEILLTNFKKLFHHVDIG